eukprot:1065469-Amphidinium_carterae.1
MLVSVFQRPERVCVTSVWTAEVTSGSTAWEESAVRMESRACSSVIAHVWCHSVLQGRSQ